MGTDGVAPPLPSFNGAPPHHTRSRLTYWRAPDKNWFGEMLPRVEARPASTAEPRRYLELPAFSTCTVPVLLYGYNRERGCRGVDRGRAQVPQLRLPGGDGQRHYPLGAARTDRPRPAAPPRRETVYNFGHSVREFGSQLYSALAETPWAAHVRPVLVTPFGTDVVPANRAVLQPLARLRLDSWAEFSSRLPDDQVGWGGRQVGDDGSRAPAGGGAVCGVRASREHQGRAPSLSSAHRP